MSNQQKLIYAQGEKVTQSPVHGGLIPPHGGTGALGTGPVHGSPNNIPFSESGQLNGGNVTLSALGADGYYTVTTNGTVDATRTIGSTVALTGDLLLEIIPLASPPNIMFGFRSAAPGVGSSYADAAARENLQTEGGGGGANWTGTWKQGVFSGNGNAAGRNGNLFMERVGTNWFVRTGLTDFASSALLYTLTAVDAAARYLAITDIGVNANFKFRFRQHP